MTKRYRLVQGILLFVKSVHWLFKLISLHDVMIICPCSWQTWVDIQQ